MLTRSGWSLLGGSVALVLTGRLLGLTELYLLGAIALALVVVAVVRVRRRAPRLDIERVVHPRRVHLGVPCRVELRVANAGRRRTPVLTLLDPVTGTGGARIGLTPLAPGERRTLSYPLPTGRRGLVDIGPLQARRSDPFELAAASHQVAGRTTLTVLPAVEPLAEAAAGPGTDDPLAGLARPVAARGDDEFASLRPYVVGDDLRRVHWPTTARSGDLVVRQTDPPRQGHLTVLLDARSCTTDPVRFEVAVSAAASLLHAVAGHGDRARLVITDGTAAGGVDTGLLDARAHRDALLEQLAVVTTGEGTRLGPVPPPPRSGAGGLVVVTGTPTADDLATIGGARGRYADVRLVVVDPSVVDGRPPTTVPGGPAGSVVPVVVVDGRTPFGVAWVAAGRRAGALR